LLTSAIDDNQLSGTVPADLALQSSLQKLNLSHNAFSGALALPPLAAFGECYAANNMFSTCSQGGKAGSCCDGLYTTRTSATSNLITRKTSANSTQQSPTARDSVPTTAGDASTSTQTSVVTMDFVASSMATGIDIDANAALGIAGGFLALIIVVAAVVVVLVRSRSRRAKRDRNSQPRSVSAVAAGRSVSAASEYNIGNVDNMSAPVPRVGTEYGSWL